MNKILIKKPNNYNRFLAFTLAEVLITLGIIGVVAAMTIPTLINNYQKQQYVGALKKAYTAFNQAFIQLAVDNNCTGDLKCTGFFDSSGVSDQLLGNEIIKYIKVTKNCSTNVNQGCWAPSTNLYYDASSTVSNSTNDTSGHYKFLTADGMSVLLVNYRNDCNTPTWSTGRTGHMNQTCGKIIVDVNGLKNPNASGRDTFQFYITNSNGIVIYPRGGADDNSGMWAPTGDLWWKLLSGCQPLNKQGYNCTGRVVENNWTMDY